MLKILRDRMLALGRGEEGVAMVVTLGIFMFLYVVCASVYAVGWTVKEKLHLQGACDAAAYSAAVVQADTLSRIATINRAMSWTYQQMTRRQMDYIVWQWLEETKSHYKADRTYAKNHARETNERLSGSLCELGVYRQPRGWDIDGTIVLNGHRRVTESDLEYWCGDSGFGNWLGARMRETLYSQKNRRPLGDRRTCGLGLQIDDDLRNIRDMSEAVESLARELPRRVDEAVYGILRANVPDYMTDGDCRYCIRQERNPRGEFFRTFSNTSSDELIFLSLGNKAYGSASEAFDTGIDDWFELGGTEPGSSGASSGIHRLYDAERAAKTLQATWTWWSKEWKCIRDPVTRTHTHQLMGWARRCTHSHDSGKCSCSPSRVGVKVNAVCRANNNNRYDNRYNGTIGGKVVWAKPLKLKESYFGPKGTITVALARRSENPWSSVLGRVGGGIYSAFSPVANSWSFCFSSAKAGYKLYHVPKDFYIMAHLGEQTAKYYREDFEERYSGNVRVFNGPRDYCVDWKPVGTRFADWEFEYDEHGNVVRDEHGKKKLKTVYVTETLWRQSWNLIQDDWDAVMVPVRQGGTVACEKENYSLREWWRKRLQDYARNDWQKIPYRFEPAWGQRNDAYLEQVLGDASWATLSGSGVPNTSVTAGPAAGDIGSSPDGQWDIGAPGQRLNWRQVGKEMYH